LIGGVAIAFLLELFNDRLETPDRVEDALQVPVLVAIPDLRTKLLPLTHNDG
jgi:capsular polysaccharide biosynthesis protein